VNFRSFPFDRFQFPLLLGTLALGGFSMFWVVLNQGARDLASLPEFQVRGDNLYQKLTGEDSGDEREHWNALFRSQAFVYGHEPSRFVVEKAYLIPTGAKILITPLEEGRNAVYLAEQGHSVTGVDFSDVAIQKAIRLGREHKVNFATVNADLSHYTPESGIYDVAINIDLHLEKWIPHLKRTLKRGGILFYEATQGTGDGDIRPGELKKWFNDFETLFYRETTEGQRNAVYLIARKP
jgi:hypothetical protein